MRGRQIPVARSCEEDVLSIDPSSWNEPLAGYDQGMHQTLPRRLVRGVIVLGSVAAITFGASLASATQSHVRSQGQPAYLRAAQAKILRAARAEWLVAPLASGSADQNVPIVAAWTDLQYLGTIYSGNLTGTPLRTWALAARQLRSLQKLPDSEQTRAQKRLAAKLDRDLDEFFRTPGLWGAGS